MCLGDVIYPQTLTLFLLGVGANLFLQWGSHMAPPIFLGTEIKIRGFFEPGI